MTRRRRPSHLFTAALSVSIAILALNAATTSDAASGGTTPSDTSSAGATPATTPKPFTAVRGDRTSGWLPQTRSEVLARNGVVATSQPLAAQAGLNILEVCAPKLGVNLAALGPRSPKYWHLLVEAKKLAYTDLYAYNGDPGFTKIPVERLISKAYAAELCGHVDMKKASTPEPKGDPVGGTVYLTVADRWGNMVSFIYSVYDSFGSGITVPGYGFVLNDRGALFSLDPHSPNVIAPHKRPFHTLIPGFLLKDGQPVMSFGLMGGSQQAQGHAQVLVDMIDLGANPQAASDAARFTHAQETNTLDLESNLYDLLGMQLHALGHKVESANGEDMGGFQAIGYLPPHDGASPAPSPGHGSDQPIPGVYRAASDHRKDGQAVGW